MMIMNDYLTSKIRDSNDTFIKTYFRPNEVVSCEQVSILSFLKLMIPILIQCSLLYPYFEDNRGVNNRWWCFKLVSRYIRFLLIPINIYNSLKFSIDFCFKPLDRRGYPNLALACLTFTLASKSLEWGLIKSYRHAKILRRDGFEFNNNNDTQNSTSKNLQLTSSSTSKDPHHSINSKHQLSSASSSSSSNPSNQPNQSSTSSFSFLECLEWTLELASSPRGVQYEWGVKSKPDTTSWIEVIKRIYQFNLVHVVATSFSILSRDMGSAKNVLLFKFGIPDFKGLGFLSECLSTLAFGFYIVTMIELIFDYLNLLVHLINWIDNLNLIKLPKILMRSCFNLKTFNPLYNQPHLTNNLIQLWGKAWHQNFRQTFIFCGALPASRIARSLGLNITSQRIAALFGSFFISGILHEYAIHFVARKPHERPHILYQDFPGSWIYFMLQPIGILIEPYVMRIIPDGAGTIWCYIFTVLSALPFKRQYFDGYRVLDRSYPSVNFTWFITSLLIPLSTSRG